MRFAPDHHCAGLAAHGLAATRGGEAVFAGLDFSLASGTALLVQGPNGAGKSSLLMILAGLLAPAAGRLDWQGIGPEARPAELVHYLGHRPAVRTGLTVSENLGFWSAVLGGSPLAATPALEAAGLGGLEGLDAAVLSAGQARRLALARLAAVARPVWLLDEPTTALDAQGADWVARRILAHLEDGGLAVIATHLPLGIEGDPRVSRLDLTRHRA